MHAADLERAMEIAAGLKDAPHWPRAAYEAAVNPESTPRRIALAAEVFKSTFPQGLKPHDKFCASRTARINPRPFKEAEIRSLETVEYDSLERAEFTGHEDTACEEAESRKIAGFLVAVVVDEEAELETIAVDADGQRQGMGRRLMEALVEELKAAGVRRIFLEARASNGAAEGLYRALGFSETGRRRGYYADPVEDAVLMSVRLR
jgi:ribosomal-protein-alanine N-acetyltransferase